MSRPVHPHVRGEYRSAGRKRCGTSCSPPRAWGVLHQPRDQFAFQRFTPTCVGSTSPRDADAPAFPVHPPVRGEYVHLPDVWMADYGSPPRAWGVRCRCCRRSHRCRFTPTCVGSTRPALRPRGPGAVHPHVRGEYDQCNAAGVAFFGSPPRAWGVLCVPQRHLVAHRFTPPCVGSTVGGRGTPVPGRFTPTCVGSTRGTSRATSRSSVHPHVRGEYVVIVAPSPSQSGSPPRAWGVLHLGADDRRGGGSPPRAWGVQKPAVLIGPRSRFTPTCVGSTYGRGFSITWEAVHPHVRGEYRRVNDRDRMVFGSPPRAWGVLHRPVGAAQVPRFTPTCVGSTSTTTPCPTARPVHPHVRGEYRHHVASLSASSGSPPRAWGVLRRRSWVGLLHRFTPTCVGSTRG